MVIGSFSPWLIFGPEHMSGPDIPGPGSTAFLLSSSTIGLAEGAATLMLAIAAVALGAVAVFTTGSFRRMAPMLAAACLGLATAVAIVA